MFSDSQPCCSYCGKMDYDDILEGVGDDLIVMKTETDGNIICPTCEEEGKGEVND